MKIRKILGLMFAATLALVGCSGSNGPTTLKGVSLSGTATKLTYNEGDKFDPTGLTITASYKDSSFTKDVTSSVVWEDLKVGMTSVIGTYTENMFSASVTVSGITVNKMTWTAAEKSIIDTHFYGADIPYVGLKDSGALTWDSEYEVATKSGGTSTKAILDNFATAFNGWEDYSCVDAEYVAEYESYYYCFEKEIKTGSGSRFVDVTFYGAETSGDYEGYPTEDGTGLFTVEITDPYYYEWPTETVEYVVESFESTASVPAFNGADYYEINSSYYYYGYFFIYCYGAESTDLASYGTALTDAGYTLGTLEGFDAFYVASTNDLGVGLNYDTDYASLDIAICAYEAPLTEWPADLVAEALTTIGSTSTVPAFNDATEYEFDDSWIEYADMFNIYCYTEDATSVTSYGNTLDEAGYTNYEVSEEYESYYSEAKDLAIDLEYDTENKCLVIYVSSTCPAEEIVLNKTSAKVKQGATLQLEASFGPLGCIPPEGGVTWTSSSDTITVDDTGLVTVPATEAVGNTATITCSAEGLTPVTCTITVKDQAAAGSFERVSADDEVEDGLYLLVCEESKKALNGSLTSFDVVNNGVSVTIDDDVIEGENLVNYAFTITYVGDDEEEYSLFTVKSASGYYIGTTADSNSLKFSQTTAYNNYLTYSDDEEGLGVMSEAGAVLRYNSASDQNRFRYYSSSKYTNQKDVVLYVYVD